MIHAQQNLSVYYIMSTEGYYNRARGTVDMGVNAAKSFYDTTAESARSIVPATTKALSGISLLAKTAFIIGVMIAFVILFRMGIALIAWYNSPSKSPYIINGMMAGNQPHIVSQDPADAGSVPILRSNNEKSGIEFTWSTWLFLDSTEPGSTRRHIFNKGVNKYTKGRTAVSNGGNGPGLYLDSKNRNNLVFVMETANPKSPTQYLAIKNVPLRNWFHLAIRLQGNVLDVYVNGTIAARLIQESPPSQNYYNVNVNQQGGFPGRISNLRYYNRALDVFEINRIVRGGPNLKSASVAATQPNTNYNYLARSWYASQP